MIRQILLFFLMMICVAAVRAQQWTVRDSLWLQNVMSGKDTLRLNPETMKSIREGGLINLDSPNTPMMGGAPSELPIVKDFSEYLNVQDSVHRKLPLTALPSDWVLRYYNPEMPIEYRLSDNFFDFMPGIRREGKKPSGYDFVHALNMAFSKEYRQHYKNSKKAENLRFYSEMPIPEMEKRMVQYRLDHPDKVEVGKKDSSSLINKPALPLPLVTSRTKQDSIPTSQSSFGQDSVSVAIPADSLWSRIPRP